MTSPPFGGTVSLRFVIVLRLLAIVGLAGTVAGCTAHQNTATDSIAPPAQTVPAATPVPLRLCAGLVGKPTSAAIIGMQVTCSFGGTDIRSTNVNVQVGQCPNTSPFYVFYSTAADATDKAVYYGSYAGPLFQTTKATSDLAHERTQVCSDPSQ